MRNLLNIQDSRLGQERDNLQRICRHLSSPGVVSFTSLVAFCILESYVYLTVYQRSPVHGCICFL